MRIALGLSALVLSFAGAGCSLSNENNDPGTAGRADELGPCEDVWIDGETLDSGYEGCTVEGQSVLPSVITCESGEQLTTYDDTFYALLGGEIVEASSTAEYDAAYEECTGEPV